MRWPTHIGRYQVKDLLGVGGTAEVLLGVAPDGSEVALKCVLAEHGNDAHARAVLLEEGRLLSQLRDPHVVSLVEIIEAPVAALALERLRGATLAEIIAPRAAPLSVDIALDVVLQTADALAAIHRATDASGASLDVVHRDVSPENLFVTTAGVVKLFDFNVAFTRDRRAAPAPGTLQGRIAYMAPEQARADAVDGRADVFSLGVVAWELVTGRRLFWRGNTLSTLRALFDEPIARVSASRPEVSPVLDALIERVLVRDRAARPTAVELAVELRGQSATFDAADARARLGALASAAERLIK